MTKPTHPPIPTATGAGFFTPDNVNTGNLFRKPEPVNALPVRMGRFGPRDSMWDKPLAALILQILIISYSAG
jgi:hypothetical protein